MEEIWMCFSSKVEDLFQCGYKLPHQLQVIAITKVDSHVKQWKDKLGTEMGKDHLTGSAMPVVRLEKVSPEVMATLGQAPEELLPEADDTKHSDEDCTQFSLDTYSVDEEDDGEMDFSSFIPVETVSDPSDDAEPTRSERCTNSKEPQNTEVVSKKQSQKETEDTETVSKTQSSERRVDDDAPSDDLEQASDGEKEIMDPGEDTSHESQDVQNTDIKGSGQTKPSKSSTKRQCHLCFAAYRSDSGFRYHMSKHEKASFPCSKCSYEGYCSSFLDQHMALAHFDKEEKDVHRQFKARLVSLQKKGKTYNEKIDCEICGKEFNNLVGIKNHMEFHKSGPLSCPHCPKVFFSKAGHAAHVKLHKGDIYKCSQCNFVSGAIGQLNSHRKRVHLKKNDYLCDICAKGFVTAYSLQQHKIAVHTPEEQRELFPCPQCGHKASSKSGLKTHIQNIHMESPGFVCNICGVTLKYKQSLLDHQLRHTSKRSYACSKCSFKALNKTDLNRHMSRTHCDPTIKCDICGKMFKQSFHLKRHRTIHTGEKSFSCTLCSYQCNVKGNLSKHMAQVHKKVVRERPVIERIDTETNIVNNETVTAVNNVLEAVFL